MSAMNDILHGMAVKKNGTPKQIAELTGYREADAVKLCATAVETGRAVEVDGKFTLTPLARIAIEADYSRVHYDLRKNAEFMDAYEAFERINLKLKALITDWQTLDVGGQRVPNDHSNKNYDTEIINRLAELHETADRTFAKLVKGVARLGYYRERLLQALERAEEGEIEWVSDVRIESYHTLWFELHEDLLRLVGRQRVE